MTDRSLFGNNQNIGGRTEQAMTKTAIVEILMICIYSLLWLSKLCIWQTCYCLIKKNILMFNRKGNNKNKAVAFSSKSFYYLEAEF